MSDTGTNYSNLRGYRWRGGRGGGELNETDIVQVERVANGYLVRVPAHRTGGGRSRRAGCKPTTLVAGEVPIRVRLDVPQELFEKPAYEVRGTVEMDTAVVLGELRARGVEVIAIAPPAPEGSEA